jgi:hypothetical protein
MAKTNTPWPPEGVPTFYGEAMADPILAPCEGPRDRLAPLPAGLVDDVHSGPGGVGAVPPGYRLGSADPGAVALLTVPAGWAVWCQSARSDRSWLVYSAGAHLRVTPHVEQGRVGITSTQAPLRVGPPEAPADPLSLASLAEQLAVLAGRLVALEEALDNPLALVEARACARCGPAVFVKGDDAALCASCRKEVEVAATRAPAVAACKRCGGPDYSSAGLCFVCSRRRV